MNWQDFKDVLQALQFDDAPAGGCVIVKQDGQTLVNESVGLARLDEADGRWHEGRLSVNFSIGKGVMATLIAVLVSKGLMDYDTPISHYWHEFAVNDKKDITPRQILTHSAGLFDVASLTDDVGVLTDWQMMVDKVAQMSPSTPKSQDDHHYQSAYSALVSGWILGALVERVCGIRLQEALDEHLARPLGVAGELFWGLPLDKLTKVAKPLRYFGDEAPSKRKPTLRPDSPNTLETLARLPIAHLWSDKAQPLTSANINRLYFDTSKMNLLNYKNALMPNGRDGLMYHTDTVLQSIIPAANGVSSTRALSAIYEMHACGGVYQGKTLISPNVLSDLRQVRVDGLDAVMPANMRWRTGFHRLFSLQHAPNAYGHMGYNGSVAFCNPDTKMSFVFIHNFDTTMLNDIRQFALMEMAMALIR